MNLFVFDLECGKIQRSSSSFAGEAASGAFGKLDMLYLEIEKNVEYGEERTASIASIHHGFGITRSFHPA